MSTILINATAIKTSGSLTLLNDFIHYLEEQNDTNTYHLFTSLETYSNTDNIVTHIISQKKWINRIRWDQGGLYHYCKVNSIYADLIISMQNTCSKYRSFTSSKSVPQLVYYHQSIPLIKYRWNIFDKREIVPFLYAHFYPFFVKRNSNDAFYIVQLPYIRDLFLRRYKHVSRLNIAVVRPNPPKIFSENIGTIELMKTKFCFFYPATSFSYKNHKILIDALCLIRRNNPEILSKIQVIFTVTKLDRKIMAKIAKFGLKDICNFIGPVSYSEVLKYYNSVQAVLFPSRIETFGLPLIEAASFGLPIIVSKLPYAEEVLEEYENKKYLDPLDVEQWANGLQSFLELKKITPFVVTTQSNTWEKFMNQANLLIQGCR